MTVMGSHKSPAYNIYSACKQQSCVGQLEIKVFSMMIKWMTIPVFNKHTSCRSGQVAI